MNLIDMFIYSVRYLLTQRLRSWLTIIGIVIGVATIVSLVSIGDGIREDIESQLEGIGSNYIIIVPVNVESGASLAGIGRAPTSGKLYEKDYQKIRNIPGVGTVLRFLYGQATVQFKDKIITAPVYAGDAETFEMYSEYMKIESGRKFNDGETGVVVLGHDAANNLFGKDKVKVNNKMVIGGKDFRVVGVFEKIGTSMSQQDDESIYITYRDGRELFKSTIAQNEISILFVDVDEGYDPELIKETIEQQLIALHKVTPDNKDFSVITADFVNKMIESITGTLMLFLLLISSVSAFVGGIGISNTMFMSVMDRTREIGVLKSIGATGRDILMLFIMEAAVIGLVGGVIGLGLGVLASEAIKEFGIVPVVEPLFALIVLAFSVLVGVVAGAVPAYNASKVPAVEALSY